MPINKRLSQEIINAPWKGINEIKRRALWPLVIAYCHLNGIEPHSSWRIFGMPLIQCYRGSKIIIGKSFDARSAYGSNPLGTRRTVLATRSADAQITIGNNVGTTGLVLVSDCSITIGDHVKIGNATTIVDTDFHPLDPAQRFINPNDGRAKPIVIENNVFIGMNVIILKGSHIGARSVIGGGAVVSGTIPPDSIAVGNPATIIHKQD